MARTSKEEKERLLSYLPPVARHIYDHLKGANSLTESRRRNYKAEIMQMARQRGKEGALTERQEPDVKKVFDMAGAEHYAILADLLVSSDEYEELSKMGAALGEDILKFSQTEISKQKTLKAVREKGLYQYFLEYKADNLKELGVTLALSSIYGSLEKAEEKLIIEGRGKDEKEISEVMKNFSQTSLNSKIETYSAFCTLYMAWSHDYNKFKDIYFKGISPQETPFVNVIGLMAFIATFTGDEKAKERLADKYYIPSLFIERMVKASAMFFPQTEQQTIRISKELIEGNFKSLQSKTTKKDITTEDITEIVKKEKTGLTQESRDLAGKALKLIKEDNYKQLQRLTNYEYFTLMGLARELSEQTQSAHPGRKDFLVGQTGEKGEIIFKSYADLCNSLGFDESKKRTLLNVIKRLATTPRFIYKYKDNGKDKFMRWELDTYIKLAAETSLTNGDNRLVIRLNEVFWQHADKRYWLSDYDLKRLMDKGEPPSTYVTALVEWLMRLKAMDSKKVNTKISKAKLFGYMGLNSFVENRHPKKANTILKESLEYIKSKGFIQDYKTEQKGKDTILEFTL